jgi:hypothetical protein
VPVAKVLPDSAGLISSEGTGKEWIRVEPKESVHSRDLLVVIPGLKAELEPRPNSVRLTLWGNLPELSDSPVLESAVILHDSRAYDLDLTLMRGRIVLTNVKKEGPAKVWLRAQTGVSLTLAEPGTSVALELYGRWLAGVPFSLKKRPGHAPVLLWEVHVLKGRVDIKADDNEWSMSAPPGPSYFHGDSVRGPSEGGPQRRARLPEWADPKAEPPPDAKVIREVVKRYQGRLKSRDPEEVRQDLLAEAAKDKNKTRARMTRELMVYAAGALDDVVFVADTLASSKYPEMRLAAVVALRHWIGEGPGRDEMLYELWVGDMGFSKAEAQTVMQMLHSPFVRNLPETYDTLIAYLGHGRLAIRQLAIWHLRRLAPAGRDIEYDPAASAKERARAIAAWRKLIPSGELPPEPKKKKKGKKEK